MFISVDIEPKQLMLVKLSTAKDSQVTPTTLKSGDKLETDSIILTFDQAVSKDSQLSFTLTDKEADSEEKFNINLNYWPSHIDYNDFHGSGAYCFRPIDNVFSGIPYSELKSA